MSKLIIAQLQRCRGGALIEPAADQRRFEQTFLMGKAGGAEVGALFFVIPAEAGIHYL